MYIYSSDETGSDMNQLRFFPIETEMLRKRSRRAIGKALGKRRQRQTIPSAV